MCKLKSTCLLEPEICHQRQENFKKEKGVKVPQNLEEDMVEECAHKVSIQYMIEQLECQLHGRISFKETHEPQNKCRKKNAREVEGTSKLMADGIMAYVKVVVSQTISSVRASHDSNHFKDVKQGLGSSKIGDIDHQICNDESGF